MGSPVKTPVLILNFKAYPEALGPQGIALAQLCDHLARRTRTSLAIAPALVDLALVARTVSIPVLAQHCDPREAGSQTGWVVPESVKAAGALGTLLNHAEHPLPKAQLESLVRRCSELGLETVVCANDLRAAKVAAAPGPTFVAIEPPELIGGDVSVTSARPEVVRDGVQAVHGVDPEVRVLCGAGVKTGADVRKALELGTDGVLLASGVVKAPSPAEALEDLLSGFDT